MEKVDRNAEILKQKKNENKSINQLLMNEKSDRIAELKMRREQLDLERRRIMDDLESVRKGDAIQKRPNYGLYAAGKTLDDIQRIKNYGIGNARDKIQQDEQRINYLKSQQ
jgi:hypothetical protein